MGWRKILFALDRTDHVEPWLLRKLTHLARGLGAEIELFQSAFDWAMLTQGGLGSAASDLETRQTLERRDAELDRVVAAFRSAGVRAHGNVSCEKLGCENILRRVAEWQPDLLIVRSRPHSPVARIALNYIDFKLIETCPCALLLLKTEVSYLNACVLAAVDPMHPHDEPAALDEAIVDTASLLTGAVEGTLHICHALAPSIPRREFRGEARVPEVIRAEVSAAYGDRARARVHALARRVTVRDERVHLALGDPAEVVPRFADVLKADVVVMGAVARSALQHILVGHTAERVLDTLRCDVLVIKPPGFRRPGTCDQPISDSP
jgi:universal stress protein E